MILSRVFVPAELPARYAIAFLPAVSASDSDASIVVNPVMPVPGPVSSSAYSVVSSANFVIPPACIEPNP